VLQKNIFADRNVQELLLLIYGLLHCEYTYIDTSGVVGNRQRNMQGNLRIGHNAGEP
jgi:hypothetical protein